VTPYFDTGECSNRTGLCEYSAATRRYTLGPSVEWRPSRTIGFEVGALYHRMGYVGIVNRFDSAHGSFGNSSIDVKGNSRDFPVVMKYRFGRTVRPYALGGGVLRYVGPVRGRGELTTGSAVTGTSTTTPIDTREPSELRKRFYPGVTAGGGVELPVGRLHLLQDVRYVRWTANISGPGGLLRFTPKSDGG
jgi:hypothetical protein